MWAARTFAGSQLPDERLNRRLVQYAAAQAVEPAAATCAACKGDVAAREGAYRFLENSRVTAESIEQGPFARTAELCRGRRVVLVIQDTTSVSVRYRPLADEIRSEGSPTGFVVHNTLAVDGINGEIIGLIDQQRWIREPKDAQAEAERRSAATGSESDKWELARQRAANRLADAAPTRLITVADREADIYDFLRAHADNHQGCVIRAKHDRVIELDGAPAGRFIDQLESAPIVGHRAVVVQQRGGQGCSVGQKPRDPRKQHTVEVEVRVIQNMQVAPPSKRPNGTGEVLIINAVLVRGAEPQPDTGTEPLQWILLTTEPVETWEQIEQVIQWYQQRWTVEEFHKCWKTGCRLEYRPFQDPGTIERIMVILAAIAVRMMQLHRLANSGEEAACDSTLNVDEWQCLWRFAEPKKDIPTEPPSAQWAFNAIAKLGGWYDTKRTGRVGWKTIWRGWEKLHERVEGWRAARQVNA